VAQPFTLSATVIEARVRAVVFDLDGTLVDSRDDIVHAVNFALVARGFSSLGADEIASFVGDGASALLSRASRVPGGDPRLDALLSTFLEHYAEHAADRTRAMRGATAVLDALAAFPMALCTNKPRSATELVLRRLDLGRYFSVVVSGGDLPMNKPDPAPLFHIAERLGFPPASLVMIGDGPQDVESGRRAGARTIGVLGGFSTAPVLAAAGPDALVASLADLPAVIAAW
jgi:phosphoglycolate phosphatase